jgi:hypothetical protein
VGGPLVTLGEQQASYKVHPVLSSTTSPCPTNSKKSQTLPNTHGDHWWSTWHMLGTVHLGLLSIMIYFEFTFVKDTRSVSRFFFYMEAQ